MVSRVWYIEEVRYKYSMHIYAYPGGEHGTSPDLDAMCQHNCKGEGTLLGPMHGPAQYERKKGIIILG